MNKTLPMTVTSLQLCRGPIGSSSDSGLARLRNNPGAGLGHFLKRASIEYGAARTVHVLKLVCQLLLLAAWCILGLGSGELH